MSDPSECLALLGLTRLPWHLRGSSALGAPGCLLLCGGQLPPDSNFWNVNKHLPRAAPRRPLRNSSWARQSARVSECPTTAISTELFVFYTKLLLLFKYGISLIYTFLGIYIHFSEMHHRPPCHSLDASLGGWDSGSAALLNGGGCCPPPGITWYLTLLKTPLGADAQASTP